MKAKKTKSGKWHCRPVDHYEYVNGKRRVVLASITRDTKQEALRAAYAYRKGTKRPSGVTVGEAVEKYIQSKTPVLSPSTLRGYETHCRLSYSSIADLPLSDLTNEVLQNWVSEYSLSHSPKGVANANALLTSAITMFEPDVHFHITLPQRQPPDLYAPTDEDIKILLDHIKGTELEKAVLLAAFGTFRRGEICALERSDIIGNTVHISKSLVKGESGLYVLKRPKTPQSNRTVELPSQVIKIVLSGSDTDRIVNMTPGQVTDRFRKEVRRCGITPFRFHDLRAYAISMRHAIGIPDQYIMRDSGHKSDRVMKQSYRRAMDDKQKQFTQIINSHVENLLSDATNLQH